MILPPPGSTLFPYTTLFRSASLRRLGPPGDRGGHLPTDDDLETRARDPRSEEHTSELQSRGHLVCRLLLEKKNHTQSTAPSLKRLSFNLHLRQVSQS